MIFQDGEKFRPQGLAAQAKMPLSDKMLRMELVYGLPPRLPLGGFVAA